MFLENNELENNDLKENIICDHFFNPFSRKQSFLRKPIYAVGDAIHGLSAELKIAPDPDKKLVELVRKLAKMDVDIHKYMNRNHKGWD